MSKLFKINVSTIITNNKNQVLLQKRALVEDVFPGKWGIPGGAVELPDTSLIEALKREVKEEVGLEIKNISFYSENLVSKEDYGMSYIVFLSEYKSGTEKALSETEEVRWVKLKNIDDLDFTPKTKELLIKFFEKWKKHQ